MLPIKVVIGCFLLLILSSSSLVAASGSGKMIPLNILPARNESKAKEFDKLLIIEGISNLVGQEFYDTGVFVPVEEKKAIIEEIGSDSSGKAAAEAQVVIKKIRKSRLRGFAGLLGGAKTTVKISVEIILREAGKEPVRAVGKAKAVTKSLAVLFQVRDDKVYFDQTATGQMVQRAVHDAVTKIIKKRME